MAEARQPGAGSSESEGQVPEPAAEETPVEVRLAGLPGPLDRGGAGGGALTGENEDLTAGGGEFVPAERRHLENPDGPAGGTDRDLPER